MRRAHGIDVSRYQKEFNKDLHTHALPIDFIIMKATEYVNYQDPTFDQMYESSEGLIRGAYHYLRSANVSTNWEQQADNFLKTIEGKNIPILALDFEKTNNQPSRAFALAAKYWIDYVSDATGKRVVLYTNPAIYQEWMLPYTSWMRTYPLWVAQWPYYGWNDKLLTITEPYYWNPRLPAGHKTWALWQYSADGNRLGSQFGVLTQSVDLDVFNGTVEQLKEYFNIPTDKEQPNKPILPAVDLTIIEAKILKVKDLAQDVLDQIKEI